MDQSQNIVVEETVDLKKVIYKWLAKWYLFVISLMIACLVAYLVNRYTTPVYVVSTSVLVKGPKDISNSVTDLLYGDQFFGSSSNLENETILLKSHSLISATIRELDLDIAYFRQGDLKTSQLYKASPIRVVVDQSSELMPYGKLFTCRWNDDASYTLTVDDVPELQAINGKTFSFGQQVSVSGFTFTIMRREGEVVNQLINEMLFKVLKHEDLVNYYRKELNVAPLMRESSILNVSIAGTNPDKEITFLDKLIEKYMDSGLEEKNQNANKTIDFINNQLGEISDSLNQIEGRLKLFKEQNNAIDLSDEGSTLYRNIQELEKSKAELLITEKYLVYLENYLNTDLPIDQLLVPSTYGITDPTLNTLTKNLVDLQVETKLLGTDTRIENPLIKYNRQKIEELKGQLLENIKNLKETNNISIRDVDDRIADFTNSLNELPGAEREFINIKRLYNLSETLYMFLMEKRAEAAITRASNTPDIRLVDSAIVDGKAIKPRKTRNYIFAVIIAIALPIGLIYVQDLLNTKIKTRDDLQRMLPLPYLGLVGHNRDDSDLVVDINPKSAVTESFRTIRSNLQFMTGHHDGKCKTYLITSSISGEGKSFCATNLSYILAISNKKTLLIGADLRKPNPYKHLGVNNEIGISNYLAGIVGKDEIIQATDSEYLDIIVAGNIPPNPAELLMSERMEAFMEEMKAKYDYIVIDTPPVGIVSDAIELMKFTDLNIFMVRQNFTSKASVLNMSELYANDKLLKMAVIFNDVNLRKYNYGSTYSYNYRSYGYYENRTTKKNTTSKFINIFKK